jgi:hypothetical protein
LVDAVFQRDSNVVGEGFQPADPHAVHHVARAGQRLAPVGRGGHLRRQGIGLDHPADDLLDHLEVVRIDVGQCDLDVGEFRHLRMSAQSFLVNPTLPAPMMQILKALMRPAPG